MNVAEPSSLGPLFQDPPTQEDIVLALLKSQEFVTPMDILKAGGGMRASERIRRLKARSHVIENVQKEKGTVWAVYTLKK